MIARREAERRMRSGFAVDVGKAFHSVTHSAFGGIGQPKLYSGTEATAAWWELVCPLNSCGNRALKGAGVFRLTGRRAAGLAKFGDLVVPNPNARPRELWVMAPTLLRLVEQGFDPQLAKAWVYPEARRWLTPFHDRFQLAFVGVPDNGRIGLVELAHKDRLAKAALGLAKKAVVAAIGKLRSRRGVDLDEPPRWFRPDMNRTIESYSKANVNRALERADCKPLGLVHDTAFIASDAEHPRDDPRFWVADEHPGEQPPRDRLVIADSPGRFTFEGVRPMADVLEAIEPGGNLGIRRLLDLFELEEQPLEREDDDDGEPDDG